MLKKINHGDLIIDYSEKDIVNVGYIFNIHTDEKISSKVSYKIMYQVFWLQPNPSEGDYFTLTEINKWIADGTWKYIPVRKK